MSVKFGISPIAWINDYMLGFRNLIFDLKMIDFWGIFAILSRVFNFVGEKASIGFVNSLDQIASDFDGTKTV